MFLNKEEIRLILELLFEKYGPGYGGDPAIARLQAKLSIMREALARMSPTPEPPVTSDGR